MRNSPKGRCLSILTPQVFRAVRNPYRDKQQTWHLYLQPPGLVLWQRSLDGAQHRFEFA